MTTINQNFSLYAGDSKNINITVTDDNGVPVNLSDCKIIWGVKRNARASRYAVVKTSLDDIIITDTQNGKATIRIMPNDTFGLSGDFYHEAEFTDAMGNVTTLFLGTMTVQVSGTSWKNPTNMILPADVTSLQTSGITTSSATLSWTASTTTDIVQYNVYNGGVFIGSTVGTSFTVANLEPSYSYTFYVRARNSQGVLSMGVSVGVTALADTTPPNDVTNLQVTNITENGAFVTWNASNSMDTMSYDIYLGTQLLGNTMATSYQISGLTPMMPYTVIIKSADHSGNISNGTSMAFMSASVQLPNNVTNLVSSGLADRSVNLIWTPAQGNNINGYQVLEGSQVIATTVGASFMVTGLSANTQYVFTIKTEDTQGNLSSGTSITITTTVQQTVDTTPPNDVTNLTTSNITDTSVTISWTASNSSDIASYDIYENSTLIGNTTQTTYVVTGLTAMTSYSFTVKAKDTAGNVSMGAQVSTTTTMNGMGGGGSTPDTTPPNNVTNLTVSNLTQTSFTLNWNASTSTDIASYDVYNGSTFVGNTASTSYNVTGLSAGTSYSMIVYAKDASGNESSGVTLTVTTSAPTGGWTYDFVVPASTASYNLATDTNFTHTLTNADIYGATLDGTNASAQLFELGVVDGAPDTPALLPRTSIDTFAAPSMHGGYQYDDSVKIIYFDSAAMSDYYFRIVKS